MTRGQKHPIGICLMRNNGPGVRAMRGDALLHGTANTLGHGMPARRRSEMSLPNFGGVGKPLPNTMLGRQKHVIKLMKDRAVTAFVYRTDMEGLYDWTRVLAPFLDARKSTARQGPRLGLSAQLKIDLLAKTVLEGHVYSVPIGHKQHG